MSDRWVQLLPILLLIIFFWFAVLRPARARQRDFAKTQNSLAPGDQVMLASGIFGGIVTVGDDTVELTIAPGTVVTVNRQAVARVINPVEAVPSTEPETDADD